MASGKVEPEWDGSGIGHGVISCPLVLEDLVDDASSCLSSFFSKLLATTTSTLDRDLLVILVKVLIYCIAEMQANRVVDGVCTSQSKVLQCSSRESTFISRRTKPGRQGGSGKIYVGYW